MIKSLLSFSPVMDNACPHGEMPPALRVHHVYASWVLLFVGPVMLVVKIHRPIRIHDAFIAHYTVSVSVALLHGQHCYQSENVPVHFKCTTSLALAWCAQLKPYKQLLVACAENGSMVLQSHFVGNTNDYLCIINNFLVAYQQPITKKLVLRTVWKQPTNSSQYKQNSL